MRDKVFLSGGLDGVRDPAGAAPSLTVDWHSRRALVDVVAVEKAENIDQQRPRIRALGGAKLKEMILVIFEEIICSDYRDYKIAARFGLKKATFSRFAGSQWVEKNGKPKDRAIPALWDNTAKILTNHPEFGEVAREAGVWPVVKKIVGPKKSRDEKE